MKNFEEALKIAEEWTKEPFDKETREFVSSLITENNKKEIIDRFSMEMEFGTAGLRGILGAGTFLMNEYTVSRASKGFSDCLSSLYSDSVDKGVVIGFDCRHRSEEFAKITAEVIAASGIKVYLYKKLSPTPLVPFAVTRMKAKAGIMITSSHNPKEYNGYKVYWENGAQIISPLDQQISEYIGKISNYGNIPRLPLKEAVEKGLIEILAEEAVDKYINWAVETSAQRKYKDVKIVYTPLHGTGWFYVKKAFDQAGFTDLSVVEEQRDPDPEFPTVSAPNPEKPDAMELALKFADKIKADIILATDGDTDRIGTSVRKKDADGS
ncbi:MAG: phospho-sugar mutase, partial [Actinomycetia bacterium]|nr:phospho-sugar mutase [Actinomycetes bacterium]